MDSIPPHLTANRVIKLYIPLVVVASIVAFVVAQLYISYRRLSHIPGPWLAGWSSLWMVGAIRRKQSHLEFYELAQKYGSLVRIQPNVLLTSDVELVKRINAPWSTYRKSDWYIAFRVVPGRDNVFSMRDNKEHAIRRAQLHNAYRGNENSDIEASIDRNIIAFLDLIRRKYVSPATEKGTMDLAQKVMYFTMDVGMNLATGVPLGDLKHDKDVYDYLRINTDMLAPMIIYGSIPILASILQIPVVAKGLYPTPEDKMGFGKLIGLSKAKVSQRYLSMGRGGPEETDMLQSFIKDGLSQADAVSESLTQILASTDTTATVIRTLMLYIMTSPRIYAALNAEIDTAISKKLISRPVIRSEEAQRLPYLQAVLKEGLRIFPPGTGILPKQVPPEGDTFNGIFLPGGTEIGINMWAISRNTDVFGADAAAFRPERWLEASLQDYSRMESAQEMVWGYGKFMCLGREIALIELNKIFVELLSNFEWSLVDPTRPFKSACYGGFFTMSEMWVTVTDRVAKG